MSARPFSPDRSSRLSFSDEMRVKMPLKMLFALLGIVAISAIAWASQKGNVEGNTRRIEKVETDVAQLREILIRIDERTAEMKRQQDRGGHQP